ncbi:hypothetical protein N7486_000098 [Penicillium sp. IBT 16267x]|nr:hypothetical protein N7486_000098 [Penicillium sp. IBT 16267x]
MLCPPFKSLVLAASILPQFAQSAGLDTAAVALGKIYFGTATDNPELTDTAYVTQLNNTGDFGQITPGNSQKNTFTFTAGDVIADLAEANGQKLRCHNLVWYEQLPSWVTSGTWTNATLLAAMKNHITNVVTHYKGQCYAWDVVNEGLNDDGTYRDNVFYQYIGEAYIPIAFATAAAADPHAKLYYNDYNIEYAGSKATAAQNIVKLVQSYGAKIDGVGLQAHFIVGSTPSKSSQASNMAAFTALGVEVAITELDIRMTLPETDALLASRRLITPIPLRPVWQLVAVTFSGQGAACPWDEQFVKKPAYTEVLTALGGTATGTATTTVSSTTTSSGSSATAVQAYGQCGGVNWTGGKTCVSGYTCTYYNHWYSQCV